MSSCHRGHVAQIFTLPLKKTFADSGLQAGKGGGVVLEEDKHHLMRRPGESLYGFK